MGAIPKDSDAHLKTTTKTSEEGGSQRVGGGSQTAVPVERTVTVAFAEEEMKTAD